MKQLIDLFSKREFIAPDVIPQLDNREIILREITEFTASAKRKWMLDGMRYYVGDHDILNKKRTVIGEGGQLAEVDNLPNNRIVDNQYRKMVIQKSNYLVGKPFTISCDDETYVEDLKWYLDEKFHKTLLKVTKDALNCGIGYMFVTYDEDGELIFKRFKPHQIIAGWSDEEHEKLDYFIRFYDVLHYEKSVKQPEIIQHVEVYTTDGIDFYEKRNDSLKHIEHKPHFTVDGMDATWDRLPLIAFKYNDEETPLIKNVKSLQDGINDIQSNFNNAMDEDVHNTIMVLVNYSGESLGEFRRNLSQFGAVKIENYDGANGDVRTLQVEVNSENYEKILKIFKDKLIENAMGFDAKDDRMSGTPNQMNIQSMYSDIDLDANGMETEFRSAFEDVFYFVDLYLANIGKGDYTEVPADVVFNRDVLINESEKIQNLQNSVGMVSDRTILENHPYVNDVEHELELIEEQKQNEPDVYNNYNQDGDPVDDE